MRFFKKHILAAAGRYVACAHYVHVRRWSDNVLYPRDSHFLEAAAFLPNHLGIRATSVRSDGARPYPRIRMSRREWQSGCTRYRHPRPRAQRLTPSGCGASPRGLLQSDFSIVGAFNQALELDCILGIFYLK